MIAIINTYNKERTPWVKDRFYSCT